MCFGQTTLKFRVIYTLSSKRKPLEHHKIGAQKQAQKSPPARCRRIRAGGPVIYPQKFGVQSVRIPAGSRTAATYRESPRANHHPVNPQQVAEPKLSGWET